MIDFGDSFTSILLMSLAAVILGIATNQAAFRKSRTLHFLQERIILWKCIVFVGWILFFLPAYAERGSDSLRYHGRGAQIAQLLRTGDGDPITWALGTPAVELIVGLTYFPFGPSVYGSYVLSAVLGLTAAVAFLRAFETAYGGHQSRTYANVLFFLPSLSLWTSVLGKDSWVSLGLGTATYGFAMWLRLGSGLPLAVFGLTVVFVIRPHLAAVAVIGMLASQALCANPRLQLSFGKRVLGFCTLALSTAYLASTVMTFVGVSDLNTEAALSRSGGIADGNAEGGSYIETARPKTAKELLQSLPASVLNTLVRPFVWEVHNLNALLAAIENCVLMAWLFAQRKRVWKGLQSIRQQPFLIFCWVLVVQMIVLFGSLPNLGLISRQRAQMFPFLLAALAAPVLRAGSTSRKRIRRIRAGGTAVQTQQIAANVNE